MKKILVTGGFGFIGSRLAIHLTKKKYKVIILEHPNAKEPSNLRKIKTIRVDITDRRKVEKLIVKNVYAILHLAAQSSGPKSFFIPIEDITLNLIGTTNVINLCKKNNIKRIIYASSFVVYGKHKSEKLKETYNCYPESVYATTKHAGELMLKNYAQPHGINWNVIRMYNVYGIGQDISRSDQGLVGIFMNMIKNSSKVEVKGSLSRFRDIINIEDVISGWELCLKKDKKNEIFNLGTGIKTTFRKLINSLVKISNKEKKIKIYERGKTEGDLKGCVADLTKIKKQLNFKPKVSLQAGLKEMWKYEISKKKK